MKHLMSAAAAVATLLAAVAARHSHHNPSPDAERTHHFEVTGGKQLRESARSNLQHANYQ